MEMRTVHEDWELLGRHGCTVCIELPGTEVECAVWDEYDGDDHPGNHLPEIPIPIQQFSENMQKLCRAYCMQECDEIFEKILSVGAAEIAEMIRHAPRESVVGGLRRDAIRSTPELSDALKAREEARELTAGTFAAKTAGKATARL